MQYEKGTNYCWLHLHAIYCDIDTYDVNMPSFLCSKQHTQASDMGAMLNYYNTMAL